MNNVDYKDADAMVNELLRLEEIDDTPEKNNSITLMHVNTTPDEWAVVIDKYREQDFKLSGNEL